MSSSTRIAVIVSIAVIFAVAVLYARWTHAPIDDGYIYLVYVKNLLNGNGLTYNGEKVQGFASTLWMGMLVAAECYLSI